MKKNILRISILAAILVFFIYNIITLGSTTTDTSDDIDLFTFGKLSYTALTAFESVDEVNSKYDIWVNEDTEELRQRSSRNMCIHWSSYNTNYDLEKVEAHYYTVLNIVDIEKDNAKNISNNRQVRDITNASLAYIAYYGTYIDETGSEYDNVGRLEGSDTKTAFRSLYINSDWRKEMNSIGVPTFDENQPEDDSYGLGNEQCSYSPDYSTMYPAYSTNRTAANVYASFISQNVTNGTETISKVSGVNPNSNGEYIGPFRVTYPKYAVTSSFNESVIENKTICNVDGYEYNGSYYSSTSGTLCDSDNPTTVPNNQAFYIKTSVDSEVKFTNSYNRYKARIFVFEGGYDQTNITLIGEKERYSSDVVYEFNNTPDVKIEKEIYSINASAPTNNKSANVEPGDIVIFKVTVANSGANTRINLADTIPSGLTLQAYGNSSSNITNTSWSGSSGSLDIGGATSSITLYFKCRVNNNASGSITNRATVTPASGYKLNNSNSASLYSEATVTVLGYDYSISKTTTKTVYEYGEDVTFTVRVNNTGTTSIKNIVIQDNIPTGLTYKSFSGTNWTISADKQTFTHSGVISGKTYSEFTITYTINPGTNSSASTNEVNIAGKSITNTATITQVLNKNGASVIKKSGNTATKTITVNGYHYKIEKTVDKAQAEAGDTLIYTVTVSNLGTTKIKNIQVTDELPTGLDSSTLSGTGWSKSGNVYTYANTLNSSGSSAAFTITGTIGNSYISNSNSTITNRATLTRITNDTGINLVTGIFKEAVTTVLGYNATLDKYIINHNGTDITDRTEMTNEAKNNSPVVVKQGDSVIYRISLKNTGGGTLENPQIVDELPTGLEYDENSIGTSWSKSDNTFTYNGTVASGATINLDIKCQVTMSNMYLPNITNTATYGTVVNRNDINLSSVKGILETTNNSDYIRMDEVDIAGTVWEDEDKDGLLDSTDENGIEGIEVILYDVTNGGTASKIATVTTGVDGKYKITGIQKGKDRNEYGNYTSEIYKKYLLSFCYNGVIYESTVYRDKNNINSDGSIEETYKIDSNATELKSYRDTFNKAFETISYNKAKGDGIAAKELEYTKDGNESKLNKTDDSKMEAFVFSNSYSGQLTTLWLYNTVDGEKPKTDYLNYINLGLKRRDTTDLSLEMSIDSYNQIINGHKMEYTIDEVKESYEGHIYGADYKYRYDERYTEDRIENNGYNYNGIYVEKDKENSELNIEIKYKTVITNNSDKYYSKINEIAQYYSQNFKQAVKTQYFAGTENNRYLEESFPLDKNKDGTFDDKYNYKINAPYNYIDKNGNIKSSGNCTINAKIKYDNLIKDDTIDYNKLYLTGLEDIVLGPGESIVVYTNYLVDKDESRNLKLAENLNVISEINAYSTYEDAGGTKPAGIIDKDSNPGNLGETNSGKDLSEIENKDFYEDDTSSIWIKYSYPKEGIPYEYERVIKGTVWEDIRPINGTGNGILDASETGIKNVRVELIEVGISGGLYYEVKPDNTETKIITDSNGEYQIKGFIPGHYIIRFNYGENSTDVKYNGQDYKSTIYHEELEDVQNNETNNNNLEKLSGVERYSDARDNEIRRLNVMGYSLEMYNEKAEILKGEKSSNKGELVNQTNMFADTATFILGVEKLDYGIEKTEYGKKEYTIENIDFGLVERPKNEIEFKKYIKQIKLETSTGNVLVDLHYNEDSSLKEGESTGIKNVQALNNTSNQQGFRYINIDEELLQGAKITITYGFKVTNNSEDDYISSNLYGDYTEYNDTDKYPSYPTTRNILEMISGCTGWSKIKNLERMYTDSKDYYGHYLGQWYYTGKEDTDTSDGTKDVKATIKIDNILDYVDNNLVYSPSENEGWSTITEAELYSNGYLNKNVFEKVTLSGTEKDVLIDISNVQFQTDTKNNLAITVDDKKENQNVSKFIAPGESVETELEVSTILSSENESDDMEYNNIAEIIKFTTLTGRRTVDTQTVGNAKVNLAGYVPDGYEIDTDGDGDLDYGTLSEPDTSIVERITLTPPTGYTPAVKTTQMIIYIIAAIVVVGAGVYFTPKLISIIKNRKFIK